MTIAPTMVKELREKTQAGMMECKKALEEAKGNMEAAIEVLRKKGMALAQKKGGREAKEGILGSWFNENGRLGLFVEVNCETDFVIRTDDFQNFVSKITKLVREKNPSDLEELRGFVGETLTALVAKIGENIQVRRFVRWESPRPEIRFGHYLHAGSKIGVMVAIEDAEGKVDLLAAKEIAMHVAAMNPRYLRPEEVPSEVLAKEREVLQAQVDTKKPKEIQEKIIEGKLKKFYQEDCLEQQIFVKDPSGKKTVRDWLKEISPKARIEKFVRLQVGT